MTTTSFRPPKQWVLQETETITSFANWQSNINYHLSLNNEFAAYIDPASTWSKASVANRGLVSDANTVQNAKTAAQKNAVLEQMLGLVAQFAPSLLRNDIIKKSTSLGWIWQRIRQHYGFRQSEVNFLSIYKIKRTEGERYETLYQRLVAHVEDNLLTPTSGIVHDGAAVTAIEDMSPSCERLLVYLWLVLIDERLPAYVSRVYAHDLQAKSLKDVQPQICQAMDSLLSELNAQEDIRVNRSFPSRNRNSPAPRRPPTQSPQQPPPGRPQSQTSYRQQKSCLLCKSAGRPHVGHDIAGCWFLSKFDKLEMSRTFQVNTDFDEEDFLVASEEGADGNDGGVSTVSAVMTSATVTDQIVVSRVASQPSPYICTFYRHFACKIVIDSGATSSMVSLHFVRRVGLTILPTSQGARQMDKSLVKVRGEVKFSVSFGDLTLEVEALITDNLDCDVLAGVPFGKTNRVMIDLENEKLYIKGQQFPWGASPSPVQQICQSTSVVLRNDASKVLYPGEFVEISSDSLAEYEGEVSIEPRVDSPLEGCWPSPMISRVIQGTVRIPNDGVEPILLNKSGHLAQIRRVTSPAILVPPDDSSCSSTPASMATERALGPVKHSATVIVDPDKLMTESERNEFHRLHSLYDNVFNKTFGAYNGASGPYKASIGLGSTKPPPTKPMLPLYPRTNMVALQEEADKLESLGVLGRPEDLGIDVKFTSPSFLIRKPDGTYRFVTAFNELGHYTTVLPTSSPTTDDVLRRLSSFKYIVKTDLTKAFFQIPLSRESMPYLGTVTPFKGIRVYMRSAMGQPGASEHLRELITRVLGDFMKDGFVLTKDDDLYIGAFNSIPELLCNWQKVLHRMQLNNLYLSSSKTIIAPRRTTVLGWIWNSGTISVPSHKINPLIKAEPPKTCSAMRSFIGAYKALSRCIPHYSSLMSPLENSIKGLQGNNAIQWDPDLSLHFRNAQKALRHPKVLTIPTRSDKLVMTVDASPVNDGIGAALFVLRDGKQLVSDNFSLKLKPHHTKWEPCELEALAISSAVKHFSPFIRESEHPLHIFTDSKPCIQAHNKLCKGHFSASARVSTFLSCLSEYNVTLSHIKGSENVISDYASRHPSQCCESRCQICKFVDDMGNSVVRSVSVSDVLSGAARMPFLNKQAWLSAQQECHELRRTFAYLRAGTRPSRKSRGLRNVKRYLNLATIDTNGLLIVSKPDPHLHLRRLIVVPRDILPGILHALHLFFTHCTESQMLKLFNRYFYAIGSDAVIKSVVENCHQCSALKKVPKEMFEQTSSASPTSIGQQFAADVIKRNRQAIFALRDIHSAYTTAAVIPDETASSLRSALFLCAFLRAPACSVRVDNAPGFRSLKGDPILLSKGIEIDLGNVKNINKNPCAEKCNQELELELLKVDSSGAPVTDLVLQSAVDTLNSRVRNRGLSAKEIVTCRDQVTNEPLSIDDRLLCQQQEQLRERNHPASARSKASGAPLAPTPTLPTGSLVYIKSEGDKFHPRELYVILAVNDGQATLQKFRGQQFMSKQYVVPLNMLFPMAANPTSASATYDSSSDEDDCVPNNEVISVPSDGSDSADEGSAGEVEEVPENPNRHSSRTRRPPQWMRSGQWET